MFCHFLCSHHQHEIIAEKGQYVLKFDNSYSRLRKKYIKFKVYVQPPAPEAGDEALLAPLDEVPGADESNEKKK
jgi:hypothetical protein